MTGASWVRPENVHLTLKFLGEVDPAKRDAIVTALRGAASAVRPFILRTSGLGAFPDLRRPRVLWVGLDGSAELSRLFSEIEARLAKAGFDRDERRFSPHLTLCRLKTREAGVSCARAVARLTAPVEGPGGGTGKDRGAGQGRAADIMMDFPVDSFVLFKSVLGPGGAKHIPLETVRLGG